MRVELPSGDIKEFEGQANMFEIAKSISNSLAKKAVAVKIDGVPMDRATILD
ncbi:MAG: TGS domain-containing protein [Fusobacterium sp.]|nr:TGS domain-containing protein [Fusobacterium sp.]